MRSRRWARGCSTRRAANCRPADGNSRGSCASGTVRPHSLRHGAGTGTSGGLGAGLARADLVITAEGALDRQTPRGKIPAEVARRAKLFGRPVLALAGTIGDGAHRVRDSGVDAYSGILPAPVELAEALSRGGEFLADATERALRMVLIGTGLAPLDAPGTAGPGERVLATAD